MLIGTFILIRKISWADFVWSKFKMEFNLEMFDFKEKSNKKKRKKMHT
jgi:hypothetical protein